METTEEQVDTTSADMQSWEGAYCVTGELAEPATGWESQLMSMGETLLETLCMYQTQQPA